MQTHFSPAQLQDPVIADANGILRACVHCGFCTATSARPMCCSATNSTARAARIYLIKQMLEEDRRQR